MTKVELLGVESCTGSCIESRIERTALFDATGRYRYSLGRQWQAQGPEIAFVMLNPSRANAECDDPTLRACIQFAQRWAYGSLVVVNLFGYCTAHPAELRTVSDPVGPENDRYLMAAVGRSHRVVLAWGNDGGFGGRDRTILHKLKAHSSKLTCLQLNRSGQPRHPLYIRRDLPLIPYPIGSH
jgi:hypothetical protein